MTCSLFFLSFMGEINIASLNVNGARDFKKRAQVFELMKRKEIDVLFVQEIDP